MSRANAVDLQLAHGAHPAGCILVTDAMSVLDPHLKDGVHAVRVTMYPIHDNAIPRALHVYHHPSELNLGGGGAEAAKEEERKGDAPSRPMMHGSRWCSCGIALKRCVISRAPAAHAKEAVAVGAML